MLRMERGILGRGNFRERAVSVKGRNQSIGQSRTVKGTLKRRQVADHETVSKLC